MDALNGNGAAAYPPAPLPAEPAADPLRKRRHVWGPAVKEPPPLEAAAAAGAAPAADADAQPKKKRKSRWESSEEAIVVPSMAGGALIIPGQFPKEVTLSSGIKVRGHLDGMIVNASTCCLHRCVQWRMHGTGFA